MMKLFRIKQAQYVARLGLAACMLLGLAGQANATDADLVKRGAYLATAGDCIACHTAPHGQPFAGGLPLQTPLGEIISTNITPSKTAGIGAYTLEQFGAALRKGIRADGQPLYPAMPYTSYSQLSDDDVQALYAYFMSAVTPVDTRPAQTALPFPFNIRYTMLGWDALFLNRKPFTPDSSKSVEWNRGAYLVDGLGHCSTCHTARNLFMAEDSSKMLGGAEVGGWYAPNISSDPASGIGSWSNVEIAAYLRTGHVVGRAQAAGPMAEAIDNSLSRLDPSDLQAIATYLKTVPPIHDAADVHGAGEWGGPKDSVSAIRGVPLPADPQLMNGAQLYDAHCASCHQAQGEGVPASDGGIGLPSLFHNTALGHANSNNLVMTILNGVHHKADVSDVMMPGFSKQLSDEQIVTLGNFLLAQYGNPAATVTLDQVQRLRVGQTPSPLLILARVGMAAALVVLLLLLLVFRRQRS